MTKFNVWDEDDDESDAVEVEALDAADAAQEGAEKIDERECCESEKSVLFICVREGDAVKRFKVFKEWSPTYSAYEVEE